MKLASYYLNIMKVRDVKQGINIPTIAHLAVLKGHPLALRKQYKKWLN